MKGYIQLLARVLVALIYVLSGASKIAGFGSTSGLLASLGWPAPSFLVVCAILLELGGGLALAFGFRTRLATVALLIFMIPATFGIHGAFLVHAKDAMAQQDQVAHILKNLAIMGALLKFWADGPGRYAIDREAA
jgi:putative oxidoreductase